MTSTERGVQTLLGAMQQLVQRAAPHERWHEVGLIREDYALVILESDQSATATPIVFPVGRYQVLRHLCAGLTYLSTTPDGATRANNPTDPTRTTTPPMAGQHTHGGEHSHDGGPHAHRVLTPVALSSPLPGDLVLVEWVNNFRDPIVTGVVVNSRSLPGARAEGLTDPLDHTPPAPGTTTGQAPDPGYVPPAPAAPPEAGTSTGAGPAPWWEHPDYEYVDGRWVRKE